MFGLRNACRDLSESRFFIKSRFIFNAFPDSCECDHYFLFYFCFFIYLYFFFLSLSVFYNKTKRNAIFSFLFNECIFLPLLGRYACDIVYFFLFNKCEIASRFWVLIIGNHQKINNSYFLIRTNYSTKIIVRKITGGYIRFLLMLHFVLL